jgi:acyl-CoA reductase-like NAD-dependent aldehyde dehydrogenase
MTDDQQQRQIALDNAACELSRRMDRFAAAHTDDDGKWLSKARHAEYKRMDRQLQRLDAQLLD